jgi:hypothetical protein
VYNKRGRICLFSIYKQNYELAITFLCSMMWAGALGVCTTSNLEIKGWRNAEAGTNQFFFDPCFSLVVILIESQKG